MKRVAFALVCAPFLLGAAKPDPSSSEISEIIRKFAENESAFQRARELYTYRQSYKIEELGLNGRPTGKKEVVADIIFTGEGKRTERVVFAPMDTLKGLIMTPEDEQDVRSVQPFVLTAKDIGQYQIDYVGRETLDEIECYTFAVKPKSMVEGQRYFAGLIWVDDRDLQIVKSYGRGVGVGKRMKGQKFPKFETYREQIDGKFWFPTYTASNDTLPFESGPLPIKMVITYKDYKQFKAESSITFGDPVDEAKPQPEAEQPKPATSKPPNN